MMKQVSFLLLILGWLISTSVNAQPAKIPLMRQAFHDRIDNLQKRLLKLNGATDNNQSVTDNEDLHLQLTYTVTKRIDAIQNSIESDTDNSNSKIKYLRAFAETLDGFFLNYRRQTMRITQLPPLVNAFAQGMKLDKQKTSIAAFIKSQPYEIGDVLMKSVLFEDNPTYQEGKNVVFLKDVRLHPEKILRSLSSNSNYPFTDSLISV
ncbi:MAG: hypothetical protein M3R72_01895, partial [Bacteroidota bacterium]|nr:hypothetical protein [Bacteroidota bacterium]